MRGTPQREPISPQSEIKRSWLSTSSRSVSVGARWDEVGTIVGIAGSEVTVEEGWVGDMRWLEDMSVRECPYNGFPRWGRVAAEGPPRN